jgi:hypothetical protein
MKRILGKSPRQYTWF